MAQSQNLEKSILTDLDSAVRTIAEPISQRLTQQGSLNNRQRFELLSYVRAVAEQQIQQIGSEAAMTGR